MEAEADIEKVLELQDKPTYKRTVRVGDHIDEPTDGR